MKPIFITYFPNYTDIHLLKDPGQIPFRFQKTLGYESHIICNSSDTDVEKSKQYVNILTLPKGRIKRYLKLICFFIKNRKRIKLLNIFQIGFHNIFVASLCKLLVPDVFIYLKMDNCIYTGPYPWEKIFDKSVIPNKVFPYKKENYIQKFKNIILKNYLIDKIDLFSIEDNDSKKYYEKTYPFFIRKIVTAYNGHVADLFYDKTSLGKENIILTVGRLGTYQKATDILLEAFAKIASNYDYSLHLAGKVDKNFQPYIEDFFKKHGELRNKTNFHGHVDKKQLFELYKRSKIFCLPSRFEGFAIVFPEAMYFKNAIITTKYVSPREIIEDKMGIIIEKDNVEELAEAITFLIENPDKIKEYGENAHNFAKQYLNWDFIVSHLHNEMIKRGLKVV